MKYKFKFFIFIFLPDVNKMSWANTLNAPSFDDLYELALLVGITDNDIPDNDWIPLIRICTKFSYEWVFALSLNPPTKSLTKCSSWGLTAFLFFCLSNSAGDNWFPGSSLLFTWSCHDAQQSSEWYSFFSFPVIFLPITSSSSASASSIVGPNTFF